MTELNQKIAAMRGYTAERIGDTNVFELRLNGHVVTRSYRAYSESGAWFQAPDYENELDAAYPLFLELLAAHCDPALVAGWEPGTVECNTLNPQLSNRAPATQPALAIARTWCEWKEGLKNE